MQHRLGHPEEGTDRPGITSDADWQTLGTTSPEQTTLRGVELKERDSGRAPGSRRDSHICDIVCAW